MFGYYKEKLHVHHLVYLKSGWLSLFAPVPIEGPLRFHPLHLRMETSNFLVVHLPLIPNKMEISTQSV